MMCFQDPLKHVHPDYVMMPRVSLMLRGLGNAFLLKMKMTDYWYVFFVCAPSQCH